MSVHIDTSGLEKLSKKLDKLSKETNVSLGEILTDSFISHHSKFNNLDNFMSACGIHNADEFNAFPDVEMDKFVKANTNFSTWQEMLSSAGAEYYKKQLGF